MAKRRAGGPVKRAEPTPDPSWPGRLPDDGVLWLVLKHIPGEAVVSAVRWVLMDASDVTPGHRRPLDVDDLADLGCLLEHALDEMDNR